MTHPDVSHLNDFVDARLAAGAQREVERHLADCASCREEVADLRRLLAATAALPEALPAPEGLWTEVRETIDARRVVAFPGSRARPRSWSTRMLVAAATVLVVLSSGTTALLLRDRAPAAPPDGAALLPAAWVTTETGYIESAASLQSQLDAQRAVLDPATVAAVERALATVDAAIAEARDALLRDPANAALLDLLASNHRQKVDLLRRATQLASST